MKSKPSINDLIMFVGIGLDQPKFYKRSAWLNAKFVMDNFAVPLGLVVPFDYGHGKGKYRRTENKTTEEIAYSIFNHQIFKSHFAK